MKKETPKDSKNKVTTKIRHTFEYSEFITWIATPSDLREPKTQQELSKKFGVGQDTLSDWKKQSDFWIKVKEKRVSWGHERTPDVILALYNRIKKTGDPTAVKLWLQYVESWSEKFTVEKEEDPYRKMSMAEITEVIRAGRKLFRKE